MSGRAVEGTTEVRFFQRCRPRAVSGHGMIEDDDKIMKRREMSDTERLDSSVGRKHGTLGQLGHPFGD